MTRCEVLLPYRFTLFSNIALTSVFAPPVLLPYRFTLFSNLYKLLFQNHKVLLPYRFTLFSNNNMGGVIASRFYYLIDLHYSQTSLFKPLCHYLFYYLIDLHYSQTKWACGCWLTKFYYLIDLHYSQTSACKHPQVKSFTTL